VGDVGSHKCSNDSGFPTVGDGRDAKGGNRGVARGLVGGENGVGGAATVAPFKGCGVEGSGAISGWRHMEERWRARHDVAGGGGGGGSSRGGGGPIDSGAAASGQAMHGWHLDRGGRGL
jgi:hypothetical protein